MVTRTKFLSSAVKCIQFTNMSGALLPIYANDMGLSRENFTLTREMCVLASPWGTNKINDSLKQSQLCM